MGSSVTGREKFSIEHKSVRQKIQRRLMKMCGGSGKHADIPPREYIPHSFRMGTDEVGLDEVTIVVELDEVVTVNKVFTVNAVVTVDTGHVEVVVVDVVTGRAPLTATKNISIEDRQ